MEVIVYSAPWCPDCKRAKAFLSEPADEVADRQERVFAGALADKGVMHEPVDERLRARLVHLHEKFDEWSVEMPGDAHPV